MPIVLVLILLPILDLMLLVRIGDVIGGWNAFAIAVLGAVIGLAVVRRTGWKVLADWSRALAERREPEEGILGAVLWVVAGLLLMIPGVVSDALGLLLLIGPVRRAVAALVRRRLRERMATATVEAHGEDGVQVRVIRFGNVHYGSAHSETPLDPPPNDPALPERQGEVIDADFEVRE